MAPLTLGHVHSPTPPAQAERQRLLQAWELYVQFRYNAAAQQTLARRVYFSMVVLALATTAVALYYAYGRAEQLDPPGGWSDWQKALMLLLVLSGLLQTVFNRFDPVTKYASLENAATRISSEIYVYRTRTMDYKPRRKDAIDVMKRVEKMQEEMRLQVSPRGRASGGASGRCGHRCYPVGAAIAPILQVRPSLFAAIAQAVP
eukprot:1182009-Prorocentrum_minimum.AAC.5